MKKYVLSLVLMLISFITFAQGNTGIEMADELRRSGKIYIVVGVLAIIFIGIVVYLYTMDKKITKLEEEQRRLSK
ncbi:CcmD family protein [Solitalea lacus]|uniref:CcmD family protein n=1 Tax=Solitalea lacus TaxID=2911172 RepID=UPI001EDA94DC|nr:CcmD family protein [Solitalea lacus]UKJ09326.1 CcmD family protein [Solitalea lacus]